jgi:hypothetical protein
MEAMDSLLIDIRTLVLYNSRVSYTYYGRNSWNYDCSKRTRLLIFCRSVNLSPIN